MLQQRSAFQSALAAKFCRSSYTFGGAGMLKCVYAVDQFGDSADASDDHAFAFAIMQQSSHLNAALLEMEIRILQRLREDGLPVIRVYFGEHGPSSAVIELQRSAGNEIGYVMDWVAHAVQLESKTPSVRLTLACLIAVLFGKGDQINTSELGRLFIIDRVKQWILHESLELKAPILMQLTSDFGSIASYPHFIVDLQVLICPFRGNVRIIDPLDFIENDAAMSGGVIEKDAFLRIHMEVTRKWLSQILSFLASVHQLSSSPFLLKNHLHRCLE
jgi:hypothetical protein